MKMIYQIGRLERGAFNYISFNINGKIYQSQLTSFVLRKFFQEKGDIARVVLIYPISLLLNKNAPSFEGISEEFKELITKLLNDQTELTKYLSNPCFYFEKHPHSIEADDFIVIHSIGQYEGVDFSATLGELILEIFIDMVSRYQKEPFSELYLDISSGHNIYVSALLEAGRLFLTFYKLQNFHPQDEQLKVYITFSDPILLPYDRIFKIHKSFPLEAKVFFSYPERPSEYSLEQGYMKFARQLAKEDRKIKRILNALFTYGYFFYSAIKNNTPLVLYTCNYHLEEDIDRGIQILIDLLKNNLAQTYQETPNLNFDLFRKSFLMLALYKGIVRVLKTYGVIKKDEISISEIKEKFGEEGKNLYKYFDLSQNAPYLSHEMSNTFERNKDKFEKEYKLLKEYMGGESEEIHPRNFLAHCGFERNCVYVRKKNEEILIKYKEDNLKDIEKILMRN
uniref:TIGR01897 family CRISPR-associated protein n=1 Tax=Thermodesulfobacterium geofontis TaxID=1295609 RepID=A0A7C4NTY3_9BACT